MTSFCRYPRVSSLRKKRQTANLSSRFSTRNSASMAADTRAEYIGNDGVSSPSSGATASSSSSRVSRSSVTASNCAAMLAGSVRCPSRERAQAETSSRSRTRR